MHICYLSFDYPSRFGGGGVGHQIQLIARELVNRGEKVTVVALAHPELPEFEEDRGVRVFRVPLSSFHWYISRVPFLGILFSLAIRELEYCWAGYKKVKEIHSKEPIDLLEGTETGSYIILWFLSRIKTIIRLHGERYTFVKYTPGQKITLGLWLSRLIQRDAIRRASALTSPSQAHALEIAGEIGLPVQKITVIPNFVMVNCLKTKTSDPLIPSDQKSVLFVGRLEKSKGVFELIEVAGKVRKIIPCVRFYLAGKQHPSTSLLEVQSTIQRLELSDIVVLLGHVPHERLEDFYRGASILIFPSYYETFGVAVIEAMSFGIPVVAFNAGAMSEVIDDGVNGILVSPGDVHALSEGVIKLLEDSELRLKMGNAAREKVIERYSIGAAVNNVNTFYHSLLNQKS